MNAAPKFSTEKYERFAPQKYNDLYCAAIFVVHMLIVVFSIDLSGGAAQLVAWERAGEGEVVAFAGVKKVESAGFLSEMHLFGHALKVSSLPGFVLTALLIALILSMMWLLAVKFMPVRMTYFSLWACAVMCFTLGAYGLMKGQLFGGVIGILVACFIVWMIFFDKRIEFTAGMIEQVATPVEPSRVVGHSLFDDRRQDRVDVRVHYVLDGKGCIVLGRDALLLLLVQ